MNPTSIPKISIQESVLKKLKLHLKDQMELIVARYQHGMMQQH